MLLYVYIVGRLCWAAKGRREMAEEVDERSSSRPRPLCSLHLSHNFWCKPSKEDGVCPDQHILVTGVNRGNSALLSCPLNREGTRLFFFFNAVGKRGYPEYSHHILKSLTLWGRCTCIDTHAATTKSSVAWPNRHFVVVCLEPILQSKSSTHSP